MDQKRKSSQNPKPCIYHPKGVFCFPEDIKNNLCATCGWNPEVYEKRVEELRKELQDHMR